MADQAMKVTLNFSMAPLPGWSESYFTGPSPINDALKARIDQLAAKRILPLVNVARITSYRVSAVPSRRFSRHILKQDLVGLDNRVRDVAAVTNTVPIYSAQNHVRFLPVHGMADDASAFFANGGENRGVNGGLRAFLDYLKTNAWQMQVETINAFDRTQAGLKPLTNVAIVANVVTVTVAGLGAVLGDHVLLSGLKGYKVGQFLGEWIVSDYTDPTLKLSSRKYVDPQFFLAPGSGFVRLKRKGAFYAYENITDWDETGIQASTHRVGRPPDSPRGRRSRR
jgi:hypothetical protein